MTHAAGWPSELGAVVTAQVRSHRIARGLSARELGERCGEYGLPIARDVIANWEGGRRTTITLAELLVLARVLDVAPLRLIAPVGTDVLVPLPDGAVPSWNAARWVTGESGPPVPGDPWETPGDLVLGLHREHDRLLSRWHGAVAEAARLRRGAAAASKDDEQESLTARAKDRDQHAAALEATLREVRSELGGLVEHLPELPPALARLDEGVTR